MSAPTGACISSWSLFPGLLRTTLPFPYPFDAMRLTHERHIAQITNQSISSLSGHSSWFRNGPCDKPELSQELSGKRDSISAGWGLLS